MALLNVDELMLDPDFMDNIFVHRSVQTINQYGRAETSTQKFVAVGSIQPASDRIYMQFPEMSRVEGDMEIYTKFRLLPPTQGKQADILEWEQQEYMVRGVADWRAFGQGYFIVLVGLRALLAPTAKALGPPPTVLGNP